MSIINKTIRYLFNLPSRGTRNWEVPINENFEKIDQILSENDDDKLVINQKIDGLDLELKQKVETGDANLNQLIVNVDNKLNSVVIENGNSNPEIVVARQSDVLGIGYSTIGKRIDAVESKSKLTDLNITSNQTSISSINTTLAKAVSDLDVHTKNKNNPHNVTPAQINAPDMRMFNSLTDSVEEFKSDNLVTMLYVQTSLDSQINGLSSNIALAMARDEGVIKINTGKYDEIGKKIYIL